MVKKMRLKSIVNFLIIFSLLYLLNLCAEETNYVEFRFVGEGGCEKCEKFIHPILKNEIWIEKSIILSDKDVSSIEVKMRKMPASVDDITKLLSHKEPSSVQYKEEPLIQINFTEEGKEKLAQVSAQNIGRKLAIFLNDKLLQTPEIREKIESGMIEIIGSFTTEEAKELVDGFKKGTINTTATQK
ncbi:MAG: hypothetical protein Q8O13_09825 [Candidatus Omnitrophota bacterium]|nr:hypothetical protein [Candidatus Omnitrophota bacterium]